MSKKSFYDKIPKIYKDYLINRTSSFNRYSSFKECPECEYSCCDSRLPVSINIIDLVTASIVSNRTIEDIFTKECKISAVNTGENNYLWKLELNLKKPCGFYKNNQCSIYDSPNTPLHSGRPISCATFPEILDYMGNREKYNFSSLYPCVVKTNSSIERKKLIYDLSTFGIAENIVTSLFLFDRHPFIINLKSDLDKLDIPDLDSSIIDNIKLTDKHTENIDIDIPYLIEEIYDKSDIYSAIKKRQNLKIKKIKKNPKKFISEIMDDITKLKFVSENDLSVLDREIKKSK